MTLTRYGLDEFVHDRTALVTSAPGEVRIFNRGCAFLERLVRDPRSIPDQYSRPAVGGQCTTGGSYVLHRAPGLLVTSVVWGPGAHVGPHDHHTWGMIGVLGNGIQEMRFRRVDDRDREGYARLERDRIVLVKPGEVSLLIPDVDEIHQLDNVSDRPTVEIHVYGTDLVGLERCRYNLDTGEVQRFASGRYDNC